MSPLGAKVAQPIAQIAKCSAKRITGQKGIGKKRRPPLKTKVFQKEFGIYRFHI